jgi:hypothetical protein
MTRSRGEEGKTKGYLVEREELWTPKERRKKRRTK